MKGLAAQNIHSHIASLAQKKPNKVALITCDAKLGAKLVRVIPDGRPEDRSSLGYTMLLRYGVPKQGGIREHDPVSSELIQAVLLLARENGFSHVDVISRPGGLASYLAGARADAVLS